MKSGVVNGLSFLMGRSDREGQGVRVRGRGEGEGQGEGQGVRGRGRGRVEPLNAGGLRN